MGCTKMKKENNTIDCEFKYKCRNYQKGFWCSTCVNNNNRKESYYKAR